MLIEWLIFLGKLALLFSINTYWGFLSAYATSELGDLSIRFFSMGCIDRESPLAKWRSLAILVAVLIVFSVANNMVDPLAIVCGLFMVIGWAIGVKIQLLYPMAKLIQR